MYAEEMPSDIALRSLVTICPLDQVILKTITGEKDNPGSIATPVPRVLLGSCPWTGREHISAHDIMLLITEEIGELAWQNPGQRHRLSHTSKTRAASSR